jgi:hypothetical protein
MPVCSQRSDIKSLDIAKVNLTKSISSLNHLHMLVRSVWVWV